MKEPDGSGFFLSFKQSGWIEIKKLQSLVIRYGLRDFYLPLSFVEENCQT